MISLLLAAALTAATPAPEAPAQPATIEEVAKALPLVCEAHFLEEVKLKASGLDKDQTPKVIDIFAEKDKLSPEMKAQVEGVCAFFDLGASFIINQINDQQNQGANGIHRMGHSTDKIAGFSFTR